MLQPTLVQTAELVNEGYQTSFVDRTSSTVNRSDDSQQTREVPVEQNDKLSESQRSEFVKKLNTTLQAFDTHVSLEWNDKIHRSIIRVVDSDTGKVIRQIPSEDLLRLAERISEVLGALYDKKM